MTNTKGFLKAAAIVLAGAVGIIAVTALALGPPMLAVDAIYDGRKGAAPAATVAGLLVVYWAVIGLSVAIYLDLKEWRKHE